MIYKMINFNKKNIKTEGFTLIETMVALFIFSVSILTVMSVLSGGISGINYSKNKMVAGYLSQEGIEYFRNMRDTFMLYSTDKNKAWPDFIAKLQKSGCIVGECYFDNDENNILINDYMPISGITIFPCSGDCIDSNFFYDSQSGKYNINKVGNETSFSRKIQIEKLDEDNIKITSKVTFNKGSTVDVTSLSENLSNWIE